MALIIGSTAMKLYFPDFREPKDLDFFAPAEQIPMYLKAKSGEVEPFWDESWRGTRFEKANWDYATVDELYTIKVAHSFWELKNNSWQKHMADTMYLKENGAVLDMDLYNILYPVWVKTHGAKKMNLAQAAGMFFKDAVVRIYDHDSIHDSVAFGERPLYEAILKDGETVDIDPKKLWSMNHETLVKLFREEIAATALERWILNNNAKVSPGRAYQMALRKTIVSLTRGKSARFIVDNFADFAKPHDYMAIHREKRNRLIPLEAK